MGLLSELRAEIKGGIKAEIRGGFWRVSLTRTPTKVIG